MCTYRLVHRELERSFRYTLSLLSFSFSLALFIVLLRARLVYAKFFNCSWLLAQEEEQENAAGTEERSGRLE